jgi:uncharacterized protein YmfQ (DUF2313 family)
MHKARDPRTQADLAETWRRFLLAREQTAQNTRRYRAVNAMRRWPERRHAAH